jgi:hypothetical protein
MNKTFPTTETFLIDWLGGTSGAFITMLMYNILFPSDQVEIAPSKYGHAHTNQNIISNTLYNFNELFDNNWKHPYNFIDPRYPEKSLILFDHEVPELDKFFNKYPIGKIIIVKLDEKMIPLLHANLFYKTIIEFDYTKRKNDYWEAIKERKHYLKEYDFPHDVPEGLIQQFLTDISNSYIINKYYSNRYVPPKEYSDRIYFIDFYDIIFNKTKVLTQLSDITNRPITDFVNEQYDIYLEKQKELMNTKLSWIDLS